MTWALIDQIGASVFAGMSRARASDLSKYTSQADERTMPIDILLDAEIVAQNPMVTRLLAEMQGYRLVPIDDATPSAHAPAPSATVDDLLRAIKESGDVANAWLAGHADGVRDLQDIRNINREIDEAITALLALRKGVK